MLALAAGDYLLWNWSLNGNHDVLALASGLTLPPLALVSIWLLAITAARALGKLSSRSTRQAGSARQRTTRRPETTSPARTAPTATTAVTTPSEPPSRRIAA